VPVAALQFKPVLQLDRVNVSAEPSYAAGKKALEEGRLYLALLQFDQAASLRPDWADPANARIVTLARLGRVDEALDVAERAAARGLDSAGMRHNVALLANRSGTAAVPASGTKNAQPAAPRESMPKAEPRRVSQDPVVLVAAAPAVPTSSTPSDRLRAPADAPSAPAPNKMPIVIGATALSTEGPRWVYRTPHVLELKIDNPPSFAVAPSPSVPAMAVPSKAEPAVAVATAADTASAPKLRQPMMGVEVSNGAGISGLAKATSRQLRTAGIQPSRITNYSQFNVAQTEVQYRKAEDATAARLLARKVGVSVAMVQKSALHPGRELARGAGQSRCDAVAEQAQPGQKPVATGLVQGVSAALARDLRATALDQVGLARDGSAGPARCMKRRTRTGLVSSAPNGCWRPTHFRR
jgi:LytR cell envelope-related transcriptional attenuator